ncbi:MAG TPA: L,D-transpeptidase family protein [Longimicrobiales bacterium]|nr:L,D-transpeptidase family protein [Longimicrobiales bacterium]
MSIGQREETSRFARCVASAVLALSASATALPAQSVTQDELRQRIELLRSSGSLLAGGATIESSRPLIGVYEQSAFAPAWTDARTASDLVRVLREVRADGLDPTDYNLAAIEQLSPTGSTPAAAADLDLLRTAALIRVAYDLRYGRVDSNGLGRRAIDGPLHNGDPVADVRRMISSGRLYDEALALRPDHFVYRGLIAALARLRRIEQGGGWARVPAGTTLRRGSTDTRVPLVRHRLVTEGDLSTDSTAQGLRFDESLESALKTFQHRHGLNPDGVLGRATLAELNVSVQSRIDQVRVNLERARWVTHDLPNTFVVVNVAGAMVYYVGAGNVGFETRAVVGQTYTETPVFRATMRYLELNPTWTVPSGIVGEVLGAIRRNPGYLRRENMRVLTRAGQPIDASSIDFSQYNGETFPYLFQQEPGPRNPLGRIKLMFPNQYDVYLHDTPAPELFEREQRTFSHGCIRVRDPLRLAELVLNDSTRWNRSTLQSAIDTGERRTITLESPIPVLVLYWTASADLHGELHFYRDLYQRDPALLRALDQ